MPAQLRFYGAAQEVTGSMHLLEYNGQVIALDCGLFQGRRAEAGVRNQEFPCDPRRIAAVVLSHAHIDHCGKLPSLVRGGFSGPIFATPPTCDLAAILLADAAHIQEEDALYWNKKRVRRGDPPIAPLYTAADAEATVPLLNARPLGQRFEVVPGVDAIFHEAGHMLGSAGVCLEVRNGDSAAVRIVFTGDRGRPNLAILRDPAPLPPCDYLLCESTYGGRMTPDNQGMAEQLAEVIQRTVDRGGKVIVPAFAVGRTQTIVYEFRRLVEEGRITHVPLIVDSPLAARATDVFRRHPEVFDVEASAFRRTNGDLFRCSDCEYTRSVEESKALHRRKEPMLIVSASGMCEVGRILHHLKNNVRNAKNTVLIVGYQAAGTLGRKLVEKEQQIRIFGEVYNVKAEVVVLNGFSAHANCGELEAAAAPLAATTRRAFLVHGEPDQSAKLAQTLRARGFADVQIPARGDTFSV